jgi:hypothetical protein
MSSSSRSIAAARQKRAGEQSQPMNTSRPVTSISSQGAFAQQQYQQQMMSQSIPVGSKNVRVAQNRSQTQGGRETNQNIQQQQQAQSTRISLSNAIGLITLRLGKLENSLNDAIEDGSFNNNGDNNECDNSSLPPNMKLVSDEVFENIVNRLNLLESKIIHFTNQNESFSKDISNIQTSIININTNLSFFMSETNEKFVDYENALGEIEKNFEVDTLVNEVVVSEYNGEVETVNEEKLENTLQLNHNETNETIETSETIENN